MIDIEKAKELWPPTCHGRWMSEECELGLVSVIIPTYNRAHFLTEAMASVLAQTYRPIELIVVDDGSTDNTRQVVEQWRKNCADDPQFELRYFHQENRGPSTARNLGLIESRGDFIQFLDSDDLIGFGKIAAHVVALLDTGEAGTVYGPWRWFTRRGTGAFPPVSAVRGALSPPREGQTAKELLDSRSFDVHNGRLIPDRRAGDSQMANSGLHRLYIVGRLGTLKEALS